MSQSKIKVEVNKDGIFIATCENATVEHLKEAKDVFQSLRSDVMSGKHQTELTIKSIEFELNK